MIRNEKGFTLIELMIVILIIGILVAIAIPVFNTAANNARNRTDEANLRTIDGAANAYRAEYNGWPVDIPRLVSTGYLERVPEDPHGDGASYSLDSSTGIAHTEGARDHVTYR